MLVTEYNDISIDQLIFTNNFRRSFFARFLRTNPLVLWFLKRTEAYIFSFSDLTVVMTDKIMDYVLRISKNARTLVLPNATSSALITRAKASDKYETRKELGLPMDYFYLAHIGTLTYWDGLEYLLRGMERCENIKNIKLLIIGDGDALPMIRNQVHIDHLEKNIRFFPPMPHDKAFKYLIASDVVPILKTIDTYQLCPIKYYEALGAGKPLICTDIQYINGIADKKFGRVVKCPPPAEEIMDAIEYFFSRKSVLDSWKNEILTFALENHTWEQRVSVLLNTIK